MILGTKARYAVMAMVELARHDGATPVALAELAGSQEIDLPYLEQIFSKLRKQGLVVSMRGPGGGYSLAYSPANIRITAIVRAVEESLKMTRCDSHTHQGCMASKTRCLTHDLWDGLERRIFHYLDAISLDDIIHKRLDMTVAASAYD